MKRTLAALLFCLVILCNSLPALAANASYSPDFAISSEYVYLYNMDTEKVIYEKNADKQAFPASLTKIMTCILALENTEDLDREIVTYPASVQDYLYRYGQEHGAVSLAGLYANDELTMRDMLYGMMLRSGNETAMCIAEHIGGSQEAFVQMMNERARALGATNTNFENPNGLHDPQHVTTARDMAIITQHAMTLPLFMEIASTVNYTATPRNRDVELDWTTTILMQIRGNQYYYDGLSGVKTGTLSESGRCFVSTATQDGFTYLLVVMGAPYVNAEGQVTERNGAFDDTENLYDWVFSSFKVKALVERNRMEAEVDVRLSLEQDFVHAVTNDRFATLVPVDFDIADTVKVYDLPDYLEAPVERGQHLGYVRLYVLGEEVGRVELVASDDIASSRMLLLLEQVKAVLRSFWFKFIVIFILLLIVCYIMLMILRNRNRRRYSKYKPKRRV